MSCPFSLFSPLSPLSSPRLASPLPPRLSPAIPQAGGGCEDEGYEEGDVRRGRDDGDMYGAEERDLGRVDAGVRGARGSRECLHPAGRGGPGALPGRELAGDGGGVEAQLAALDSEMAALHRSLQRAASHFA